MVWGLVAVVLAAQVLFLGDPARGQTSRPAVHVAFVRSGNIWIFDGASGRTTRLTADGHNSTPHWVAGGQALLFQRKSATFRWQPGKGIRQVRDGLWSPDGTAVAITRTIPHTTAASTVWEGRHGQPVRITPVERRVRWYPTAWSADSTRLALARTGIPAPTRPGQAIPPSSGSLWVTVGAVGAGHLHEVRYPTFGRGPSGWPDDVFWSPDGRFLTVGVGPDMPCASCRADGRPYFAIPIAGGKAVSLGISLGSDGAISWARDGSYVVLSSGTGGRETYYDKHLNRVDPTTGAHRTLTHDARWADIQPAVSPDGRHIALVRGRAESTSAHLTPVQLIATRHIFLMGAGGAHLRQLTGTPGWSDAAPVWSADGQWVVFFRWRRHQGSRAAQAALWAVRADGTGAQRLAGLSVPGGLFADGFGYYGTFGWQDLFAVAP